VSTLDAASSAARQAIAGFQNGILGPGVLCKVTPEKGMLVDRRIHPSMEEPNVGLIDFALESLGPVAVLEPA
jgi:hypothetical protein